MKDWIEIVDREYLSDFIRAGGGSVKFVTADLQESAEIAEAVDGLAEERGFVRVNLDAAGTKLHRIDQLFFEIARQIDWAEFAAAFVAEGFREAGYRFQRGQDGFDLAAIASENETDEPAVRAVLKNWLMGLYQEYSMSQEFRLAMLQLCRAQISVLENYAPPVLLWLRGELPRIAELKNAKIFQKIGRHNARFMLQSLTHWLRRNGQPGVVITLDITRCLDNPKRTQRVDGFYYSAAALTEVYETLRQLIDGASELTGTFVVVLAPPSLLSDEKRGVDRYQALKMRIFDDVRNRGNQNLLGPLVRLNGEAA